MNKLKRNIGFALMLLMALNKTFADDIEVLYNRYWDLSLNNPSKTKVDTYLGLLNSDGSFSDLDYNSTTSDLSVHLTRLATFGGAYQSEGNYYLQNDDLKNSYYLSLQYWITKNHIPDNWWYRYIKYSKLFGPCLFLMNAELQAEMPDLFSGAIDYLRWGYLQNIYMDGANGADQIYATYPSSILIANKDQLIEYQEKIKALIGIQNQGEGIEADWMFGQHSDYGRQLYSNYEHEYLYSILNLLNLCKGTVYDVSDEELAVLENHFIHGNQWYVYNKSSDPSQTGRYPSSSINGKFLDNISLLLDLNTPQREQIYSVEDRVSNGNMASALLLGNKMFWRFDYMIHRRENYYVSSRLTSTRTVCMESGNGAGIYNYYSGAGINFLFRTGNEYGGDYFTVMNYRQWPGITVEQDEADLPLVDWGNNGTNGNAFAGGVSDGTYGAVGNIYSRENVAAYKSWFYFDDEFVALGSGISNEQGTYSVFTTINQSIQEGDIIYSKNGEQYSLTKGFGTTSIENPDWIIQDSIGYVNLLNTSDYTISSDTRSGTDIFTLGINHGIKPNNSSYAYAVYPNSSTTSIKNYKADLSFQLLANTNTIQAVYHHKLKITQAVFYAAGSLTLSNGKELTVNAPCALMIKDTASLYKVAIANPLCESANPELITVTLNTQLTGTDITWDGIVSSIEIALPQGDFAGQSVSTVAVYDRSSINDLNKKDSRVHIYPNATTRMLNISFNSLEGVDAIEVYNISGQAVCVKPLSESESTLERIDISSLSSGIYFVKINYDNGTIVEKVIKN